MALNEDISVLKGRPEQSYNLPDNMVDLASHHRRSETSTRQELHVHQVVRLQKNCFTAYHNHLCQLLLILIEQNLDELVYEDDIVLKWAYHLVMN